MTNPNIEKVTDNSSDNTSVVHLKNGEKLHIKYVSTNADFNDNSFDWIVHRS